MNGFEISRTALWLSGAAMLALPVAAFAQDRSAADADSASTAEIIVTATRQNESLQAVPMAVNVATGEKLQQLKIFDAKDIQQLAPGLEMTNTSGRNNTTTLRGISFDPDQGSAPAVQVYLNEIPTDAQTAYTAIYDIQQVEVLRGPQGLLRGLSAPAGSITITTRKPNFDKVEGFAQATATDRGGYNVQGGVSLPFSDTLALRVAGVVDGNRVNFVRDINRNGQRSYSRTESARATLGWKPSPDFTAYLTYQYLTADTLQFQQVVGDGNTPLYSFVPYGLGALVPDTDSGRSGPTLGVKDRAAVQEGDFRNQNETHIVNLQFDWNLGPATLSFVGAHQFSKLLQSRDLDAGNAVPGYIATSGIVIPYLTNTAEVRLHSNNTQGLTWGIGAFYQRLTGDVVVDQRQDTFIAPVNPAIPTSVDARSAHIVVPTNATVWSFNGNLGYKTGKLSIEGGLRYTINQGITKTDVYLTPELATSPNPIVGIPPEYQRHVRHPITGGATIDYAFSPQFNAYASYGHSYRDGVAAVALPAGISPDILVTKPEKTDSYEVGIKGSVFDRRINYSVAAFYQTFKNFLGRFDGIFIDGPFNDTQAGLNFNGDAKSKGVEATLDGKLTDNWSFGVAGSYVRARWSNAMLPCNDYAHTGIPNANGTPSVNPGSNLNGNISLCRTSTRLADVPDFSLTANTEIRFPMATVTPFIRALFTYRPAFYSDRIQYNYQSRELLNLFAGIRTADERFEIDLFARNLLNQQRISNISLGNAVQSSFCQPGYFLDGSKCNGQGAPMDSGYRLVNVTNPREFGITVSAKW
jgi:iron complex outermembrane receptor protein